MSRRSSWIAAAAITAIAVGVLAIWSLLTGGRTPGLTHIDPGNVGLVLNVWTGQVETRLMPAGTHWQGATEQVIEVPTSQRTISLTSTDNSGKEPVQVNTSTNMLTVDLSCQYHIDPYHARDLYNKYQDQFEDLNAFEDINLEPSVKEAVNYAIGDMDTATALTTVGKQEAERECLAALNQEWAPQGIVFSNFMIRGIDQDAQSKELMSTTLTKMQDIANAQIALQQQVIDNQRTIQEATADATVNRLQAASLTDLYVRDQVLGRVKTIYVSSKDILGVIK